MSAVLAEPVEEKRFAESALSVRNEARALQIVDQSSYDLAAAKFGAVSALEKEIAGHYGPLKQKAFESHRAICSAENSMLLPVREAKQILSRSIGAWDAEQERKRQEEQRRLEEEARKRADEEALRSAVEAEEVGATEEEVEAVLSTPAPMMRAQAGPTYVKASGVTTRELWTAELISLQVLVKAAAENPAYLPYLAANMPALNSAARAQKQAFRIPGVKATYQRIAAGRGR